MMLNAHRAWALAAALLLSVTAHADPADAASSPLGFGSKGYVWNRMTPEQVQVLKLSGDPVRGKEAYRACRGCHRSEGVGRSDGAYPRMTGQHAIVLIKQITDTRAGLRVNPKMEPFSSRHAVTPQEIADIAVYLSRARSTVDNGQGDPALAVAGAAAYARLRCHECHGKAGEGNEVKVYPVVAAQHADYLLREMQHVQAGQRGNSHPDMVKTLRGVSDTELKALASFMSRLPDYRDAPR